MNWNKKHIVSIRDFSKEELQYVLKVSKKLDNHEHELFLKNKIMGSLFFEPSTRTRLSFHSAMKQLGGQVNGFSQGAKSSLSKGETVYDTIKMVESYSDVIVMRHFIEGSARLASEISRVPIINAGDGTNEHPTQTMLDLYTIQKEKNNLEGLNIGMVGDLKYGRTVHSLTVAMSHFKTNFYFIAPNQLKMPNDYLSELKEKKLKFEVTEDLMEFLPRIDVLYMTRIQKERFPDEAEYEKYKGIYQLSKSMLKNVKKDMIIMHPLPRVNEISNDVDSTKHAVYFSQAANGVPVRKALLLLTMGIVK
jgi:aspartate carbamoyltransferase catalytic subunit